MSRGQIKLFSNRSGEQFAKKISKELDIPLSPLETMEFADGETKTSIRDTVRGCDVYLVQSCFDPTSERNVYQNFFELLQAGDALKRAGANKLTAVLPYLPFSRQDKSTGREPLTARLVADMVETTGFDNLICADLHARQIEGFYKHTTIDNLPSTPELLAFIKENYRHLLENLVVVSPDAGGARRAEVFARELRVRAAQSFKVRSNDKANYVEKIKVSGLITDKNVLIPDDIIDTAGTIEKLFVYLRKHKTREAILCTTHALLNGSALERIISTGADLITTDTIPRTPEFKAANPWYHEISLSRLFAEAIYRINKDQSISELYRGF